MFIRKWRYEQNLENARREGIREGRRETREQKYAYMEYLEEENAALQAKLLEAREGIEILRWELDEGAIPKKMVMETLANELACYQKQADVAYYDCGDQEASTLLLEKAMAIKELTNVMAIGEDVFERAYEIYDFRNSGKEGYTLKDGKIVKIEQEEELSQTPFANEDEGCCDVKWKSEIVQGVEYGCRVMEEDSGENGAEETVGTVCDAPCEYENEAASEQDAKESEWVDPNSCRAVREDEVVHVQADENPFAEETFF